MMLIVVICLSQLLFPADGKEKMLLNGSPFPPSIFVTMDKPYLLECEATEKVYWKVYSMTGKVQIISGALVRLNEYDVHRDGYYQCHWEEKQCEFKQVFIFSHSEQRDEC